MPANKASSVLKSALFLIISILLIAPLFMAFYKYYLTKNYDYIVEASCDPFSEICYTRDCTIEECPPNGFSSFKVFYIKAFDFAKCSNNSCDKECLEGLIECEQVQCGKSEDDNCTR